MKKAELNYRVYHNKEAELKHKEFPVPFMLKVEQLAKRDAESNLPNLTGDSFYYYETQYGAELQLHCDKMRDLHGNESVALTHEKLQNQLNDARNSRDGQQKIVSIKQKSNEIVKENCPSFLGLAIACLVLLLCLADGLLLTDALRSFIPNRWSALFISLVIGAGLGILAHKFLFWWYLGKTRIKRLTIRFILISGFSSVFYSFGLLRSYQQHLDQLPIESNNSTDLFMLANPKEALMYMLISWLIFSMAILLSKYSPSFNQWKQIFHRIRIKRELKKEEDKLTQINSEISALLDDIENLKQWDYSRWMKAQRDEQGLIKLLSLAKSTYIRTNVHYRKANKRSDCFDGKGQKFYLTTYFQDDYKPFY